MTLLCIDQKPEMAFGWGLASSHTNGIVSAREIGPSSGGTRLGFCIHGDQWIGPHRGLVPGKLRLDRHESSDGVKKTRSCSDSLPASVRFCCSQIISAPYLGWRICPTALLHLSQTAQRPLQRRGNPTLPH